jgi:peptidoglycan/xylan/chitin deacetylase (PgdA/CDA1 family)
MKNILLALFFFSWSFADCNIFVYHRFDDFRYPSTNTSVKELAKEFEYLKKHKYKVIGLRDLIKAIRENRKIPKKCAVLTIDDGYKSFYENGLDVFKKYNYPFTLFIPVKAIERKYKDYMSWEEIKECLKYGEVGLHSYSHPHLTWLKNKEIAEDTKIGIKLFMKRLGFKPCYYAYPYGEYDERVKKIIAGFGFDAILNQNIGAASNYSDVFDLDRIALVGKVNFPAKLKYKELKVKWIEPKSYPKDCILKNVKARISNSYKKAYIYVTDYGWKKTEVKDGFIAEKLNYNLKKERVRVIIKVKNSKIKAKVLVKSKLKRR